MIKIIKFGSWYDVYVDNVMILHHISEQDKNDILGVANIAGDEVTICQRIT